MHRTRIDTPRHRMAAAARFQRGPSRRSGYGVQARTQRDSL